MCLSLNHVATFKGKSTFLHKKMKSAVSYVASLFFFYSESDFSGLKLQFVETEPETKTLPKAYFR